MKTIDDITSLHTIAEAKLILLMMKLKQLTGANLEQISDITGMSVPEVSMASEMLKMMKINVSRNFNDVQIDSDWILEENDGVESL